MFFRNGYLFYVQNVKIGQIIGGTGFCAPVIYTGKRRAGLPGGNSLFDHYFGSLYESNVYIF